MSVSASLGLQKALFDALANALPGLAVYDHVPANAAYPYVTFGAAVERDIGGNAAPLCEHAVRISVWSKADSRVEIAQAAQDVADTLETAALTAGDHRIVNRVVEQVEIARDPKTRLYQAQIRLRAATEPLI